MDAPVLEFALLVSLLANLALAVTLGFVVRGSGAVARTASERRRPARRDDSRATRPASSLAGLRKTSRRATIAELIRRGLDDRAIAELTGATVGEIALAKRLGELRDRGDQEHAA